MMVRVPPDTTTSYLFIRINARRVDGIRAISGAANKKDLAFIHYFYVAAVKKDLAVFLQRAA
jgi:hypothetical protein